LLTKKNGEAIGDWEGTMYSFARFFIRKNTLSPRQPESIQGSLDYSGYSNYSGYSGCPGLKKFVG